MSTEDEFLGTSINASQAIRDGARAGLYNLHRWVAVFILYIIVVVLGVCTCVGWIPIIPLVAFGLWSFSLHTLDGQAPLSCLWSGLSSFTDVFVRTGLLIVLLVVLAFPSVFMAILLGAAQSLVDGGLWTLVTLLLVLVPLTWNFVIVRFMLAPYFVVEQGLNGIDALKQSLAITEGQWVPLLKIQVAITLFVLPGNIGMQWAQPYIEQSTEIANAGIAPEAALQPLVLGLAVMALSYVLLCVGSALTSAMMPAAYRQLVPKANA